MKRDLLAFFCFRKNDEFWSRNAYVLSRELLFVS